MWSVFFVLLSYLDRNFVKSDFLNYALAAEKESKELYSMLNSTFCAKMSVIGESYLFQVSDGIEEVRSLHNAAGKLVDCSLIVNQMQVKSFVHVCRLGLKNQTSKLNLKIPFANMEEAKSICQEFTRRSEHTGTTDEKMEVKLLEEQRDGADSEGKPLKRSKRGFTYPGTLWCGAGNMADHYDHLGEFQETDSCCRIHDHCPYVIHAFSTKYGYTNFKWHSICHCDCDNALKECLRKVNDTSSRVVGQAFFNVMEVPCFEFVYEEQCVERHWYGMCKEYKKLPVAVNRESIPYDFGGIDVIDVLTVAPPKKKYSEGTNKQEPSESTTQSTVSTSQTRGPEEPSLRNVVTAAEDFIKVLATVSTSQSSNTDTSKGDTQTSEKKKKRKMTGKKKTNKGRMGKVKGRKRKQKVEAGTKVEEGGPVPASSNKAEGVMDKSNFISGTGKGDLLHRHTDSFIDGVIDRGETDQPSNDVMKDEPLIEEAAAFPKVSPTAVEKELAAPLIPTNNTTLTASTKPLTPSQTLTERSGKGEGRKRKSGVTLTSAPTEVSLNTMLQEKSLADTKDSFGDISASTTIAVIPPEQHDQHKSKTELVPVAAITTAPIIIPKTKKHRSREKGGGNRQKTWRKTVNATSIVPVTPGHSTADILKVITNTGAPTIPVTHLVKPLKQKVSLRPDIYEVRPSIHNKAVTSAVTFTVLGTKRQRSKEKRGRMRRGKIGQPLSSESLINNSSEDVIPGPTASVNISLLNVPPTNTLINRPIDQLVLKELKTGGGKANLTSVTGIPVVTTKRLRPTRRQGRKLRQNITPAAVNDGDTALSNTHNVPATLSVFSEQFTGQSDLTEPLKSDKSGEFTSETPQSTKQVFYPTTSRVPFISPIQLSIQRAKEQFGQKKRRKTALSVRPQ